MKKIGILTFHKGPNHGGFLQAYELCEAVRKLGGDPEIIDYQNPNHAKNESFRLFRYRNPMSAYRAYQKHRVFDAAQACFSLSRSYTDSSKIQWEDYDSIVIGSDVVWDYAAERLGRDSIYFGGFREHFHGGLYSYAASCGTVNLNEKIPSYVSAGLAGFDSIAVRDKTTVSLVEKSIGKMPTLVVDPTWLPLLNNNVFEPMDRGYIAVYAYDISNAIAKEVREFARKNNLRIIASGYPRSWADKNIANHSPEEWQEFIKNAKYVVTGTFHGALYSMRFGKQFLVVPNGNIDSKLETPLALAGMGSRILKEPEDVSDVLEEPFYFDEFIRNIESSLVTSSEYLARIVQS